MGLFASCLPFICGVHLPDCPLQILIYGAMVGACLPVAKEKRKQRRKPKTHRRKLIKSSGVAEKLAGYLASPSVRSTLRAILLSRSRDDLWKWLVATPPGSSLEVVLSEFREKTPIALELVFTSWICLLAEYLAERGAKIRFGEQLIRMDLYTVVLAGSGGLKSFSYSRMASAISPHWKPNLLIDPGSTAGLLTQLKKNDGEACLWRLEEFGEFWKELTKESHSGTKRLLLMNYDGEPVGKGLKDSSIVVDEPYLSFFGTTVTSNLAAQIPSEDWRSGMCQRICFVLAPSDTDPDRQWGQAKYALLRVDEPRIGREFAKLIQTPVHMEYEFGPDAISQIQSCWKMISSEGDHEFVRRVEFRAFKYAVVYHWMLGKSGNQLDAEDIGWAFRLAMLHLADLRVLLDATEYADFEELLKKGEEYRQKCMREGSSFRPRDLQMRFSRRLRSIEEAKSLYALVCESAHHLGLPGIPSAEQIYQLTGIEPAFGKPKPVVPTTKPTTIERR